MGNLCSAGPQLPPTPTAATASQPTAFSNPAKPPAQPVVEANRVSNGATAVVTVAASKPQQVSDGSIKAGRPEAVLSASDVHLLPPKALEETPHQPPSKKRTDCKLKDLYKLGKTLGTGGFSIVKLAIEKSTGTEFACKIMALPPIGQEVGENENSRDDIFKEIDLLCDMNHENVIYLKEYFEEGNKVYLITELLTGGELLDAVLKRGSYSEAEARNCFVQLLKGIAYLHSKNVTHRDLKLENLLLASPDDMTRVKIADFGLAKNAAGGMQTICGTPQYVAPEVIVGHKGHVYGPGVDMWSSGVVLYILLGGYPPFWSDSEPQLFEQIRKGRYTFDDPVWKNVSDGAKDLIKKLLVVDPKKRLSAQAALEHDWITSASAASPAPLVGTQKNLRRGMVFKRFKHSVKLVIAANRMTFLLNDVRKVKGQGQLRIAADTELYNKMVAISQQFADSQQQAKRDALKR